MDSSGQTQVEEFLARSCFAVAGVSSSDAKYGTIVFRHLRRAGKRAYGVNPRLAALDGQRVYPRLADLPESPEVLVLVVPSQVGLELVDQAARLGIGRIWMQPGAESAELLRRCEELGLQAIHNRCLLRQDALKPREPEAG